MGVVEGRVTEAEGERSSGAPAVGAPADGSVTVVPLENVATLTVE